MRKPDFCLDQLRGNREADHAFVFATRIVQFLFYLNPKFQASSSFLSLYRPVCVGPGRKPRRPVFLRRGSFTFIKKTNISTLLDTFTDPRTVDNK